jgi:hypothetical protein
MTLGFPTILIPAVQGGEGRYPTSDFDLHISKDEISWLSKRLYYSNYNFFFIQNIFKSF